MEWISVEERLPEEGVRVLVNVPDYGEEGVAVARYTPNYYPEWNWYWTDDGGANAGNVREWMPLPEPPVV